MNLLLIKTPTDFGVYYILRYARLHTSVHYLQISLFHKGNKLIPYDIYDPLNFYLCGVVLLSFAN